MGKDEDGVDGVDSGDDGDDNDDDIGDGDSGEVECQTWILSPVTIKVTTSA